MTAVMKNILITGPPGCGKTTLIRKITAGLTEHRTVGFYTREMREEGVRCGFEAVSFNGAKMILAHVEFDGEFRVGKYGVDIESFNRFLKQLDLAGSAGDYIIIDEIGKMECLSAQFRQLVSTALDSDRTVIATIAEKGAGIIDEIKKHPDVILFRLTRGNRDQMESDIVGRLGF